MIRMVGKWLSSLWFVLGAFAGWVVWSGNLFLFLGISPVTIKCISSSRETIRVGWFFSVCDLECALSNILAVICITLLICLDFNFPLVIGFGVPTSYLYNGFVWFHSCLQLVSDSEVVCLFLFSLVPTRWLCCMRGVWYFWFYQAYVMVGFIELCFLVLPCSSVPRN